MDENSTNSSSSNSLTSKINATSGSNEEDALRISTSSSWTILPAERIDTIDNTNGNEESSPTSNLTVEHVESNNIKEHLNDRCKLSEDADNQAEDVSDGISIISDCESTGRISPHPFLRDHLNDLTFKFETGGNDLPSLGPQLQQLRNRQQQHNPLELNDDAQRVSSIVRPENELKPSTGLIGYPLPTIVQNGLTAVFYVGVTLAILSFIGRLRNPEWQVLGGSGDKPSANLEQRVVELELQNNLMRAEIDIISKQLQYLNTLSNVQGQQGHSQQSQQSRKSKTFKAWPGNGNSVDPVDITKEDLKRPYKCPDGKFVEIAAMCMESKPHTESLTDDIGNVVNDVLQQSQAFQNFEKITERLGALAGDSSANANPAKNYPKKAAYHAHVAGDKLKPTQQQSSSVNHQGNPHVPAHNKHQSDNSNNNNSKERYKAKNKHKHQDHSKEYKRDKSNEYNDSKERHDWEYNEISQERFKKHYGQYHDDHSGSGEWHERMMKHREQSRQKHEQKRNSNWYIERGGSREQQRTGETRR